MVQARPARGHLESSRKILVVSRLPGLVTILTALMTGATPLIARSYLLAPGESVCGGQEDRLRLQCGRF